MAGKGDAPRPVDGDTYRANYERIFAASGEGAKVYAVGRWIAADRRYAEEHENSHTRSTVLAGR